jgi:hypothetical protein
VRKIPITAARDVAERWGYDQIVIVARKVGENGGEHVTTYGVNKANCEVAARIGDFFKYRLMGWLRDAERTIEVNMGEKQYRVTLRKGGDHSVQLVSLRPGMLTGVNVHTQEWRDALSRALILTEGDAF